MFQLNLIYGAQAFIMLVFGAVAFVMSQSAQPSEESFASSLIYILVAVVIASLTGAHFIFDHDGSADKQRSFPENKIAEILNCSIDTICTSRVSRIICIGSKHTYRKPITLDGCCCLYY